MSCNTTPSGAGDQEITLATVDKAAKAYAERHGDLRDLVGALNATIEEIKRKALPGIRMAVARAAERHAELKATIEAAPQLFESPRTFTLHGVKVGYRKGSGGIAWNDEGRVIALIEKHFSREQAELLIKTTKKPIKKALEDLDVAELKKIGCTVEATTDEVVIKSVDSEVDKVVAALLKDATETAES